MPHDFFGNFVPISKSISKIYNSDDIVDGMIVGSMLNEGFLTGGRQGIRFVGGKGDDSYYSVTQETLVVEYKDEGIDTVHVINNYVLPDHVENINIGWAVGVVGNALQNVIVGNVSAQSIDGREGDDILTGGGGGDMFAFGKNPGYDVITDFRRGETGAFDTVRLVGYTQFTGFAEVRSAMTEIGGGVVLRLDQDNAIRFEGMSIADFTESNFLLSFDPGSLTTTFRDEFDALSLGIGEMSGTWRTDYGWGGDRNAPMARTLGNNGEKQLYIDSAMRGRGTDPIGLSPFEVEDGILTIKAAPTPQDMLHTLYGYKFTSGLLTTRDTFTQTYGYFEARMEIPTGKGVWPAFWLYTTGASGSELDVMENHGTDVWSVTTHDYNGTGYQGKNTPQYSYIFTPDLSEGFHTYGVLWTAETVTWYFDGVAVKSIATPPDMHGPMYLLVNLALDSATPVDFAGAEMRVDYVRAYGLEDMPDAPGTIYPIVPNPLPPVNPHPDPTSQTWIGTSAADVFVLTSAADKVVEKISGGIDRVESAFDYSLHDHVENLTLTGDAARGTGNVLANILIGSSADNTLEGMSGDDVLDGRAGADAMIGGIGNDIYHVDDLNDNAIEFSGEGFDLVYSTVDHSLTNHIENLTLVGDAIRGTGNSLTNILNGTDGRNVLQGLGGNDILDGAGGADRMYGGGGDDTYHVNVRNDQTVEMVGDGVDTVYAAINHALSANVENLTLVENASRGIGNALNNVIIGSDRNDILEGAAGDDTLIGNGGRNRMIGGAGNDTYYVENARDLVVETANGGNDTVYASVDYVLSAQIEKLALTQTALRGTGNDEANTITGNALENVLFGGDGNDWLDGQAGADVLKGGRGNDAFIVDNVGDVVLEYAGDGWDIVFSSVDFAASAAVEQLTLTGVAVRGGIGPSGGYLYGNTVGNVLAGNTGRDFINGREGDDIIVGGAGDDRLTGGLGKDTFVFSAGFGQDTITDFDPVNDVLDWSMLTQAGVGTSFTNTPAGALVTLGSDSILLLGITVDALPQAYLADVAVL